MSDAESVDWDAIGYVRSSKYRQHVVNELEEEPLTPSEITDRSGIAIPHASRALQELRDKGLVDLLVPEERRKGRVYGLTESGEAITDHVSAPDS